MNVIAPAVPFGPQVITVNFDPGRPLEKAIVVAEVPMRTSNWVVVAKSSVIDVEVGETSISGTNIEPCPTVRAYGGAVVLMPIAGWLKVDEFMNDSQDTELVANVDGEEVARYRLFPALLNEK